MHVAHSCFKMHVTHQLLLVMAVSLVEQACTLTSTVRLLGAFFTPGQVSWDVITVYIKAMGGWPTFLVLATWFLLAEACRVGATVWLSHWTGVADMPGEVRKFGDIRFSKFKMYTCWRGLPCGHGQPLDRRGRHAWYAHCLVPDAASSTCRVGKVGVTGTDFSCCCRRPCRCHRTDHAAEHRAEGCTSCTSASHFRM